MNLNGLIEEIEKRAAKYDSSKENMKERFINACNKYNEFSKQYIDAYKKNLEIIVSQYFDKYINDGVSNWDYYITNYSTKITIHYHSWEAGISPKYIQKSITIPFNQIFNT